MKRTFTIVVAFTLAAVGCASDGSTLRSPPPGASAPPLARSTVPGAAGTKSAPVLTLTSPSFESSGPIPLEYTCDGADVSPPLTWGVVPETAVELAVTVVDRDAGNLVHWVLAGLDPNAEAIAIGGVPDTAVEAKNDTGTNGWAGPCPPKTATAHTYVFTLYALSSASQVTAGMNGKDAVAAISAIPAVAANMTGTYQRA